MANDPPDILYKYCSPKGISYILDDGKLSFTSVAELNDPFEAGADLTAIVNEQLKMQRLYAKRAMEGYFGRAVSDADVDTYFHVMEKAGVTRDVLETSASRLAWQVSLQMFRRFGVLSLAERPDVLLMWSHYTACGDGIAIGLRSNKAPVFDSKFADMTGPQQVHYSEKRADHAAVTLPERLKQITLTKSKHWEYEREWRCIREIVDGSKRLLVDLPAEAVAEIIVGPRLSLGSMAQVVELQEKKYPKAALLLASPSPSHFRMDISQLPPAKFLQVLTDTAMSVPPLNLDGRL